jgi:hypothetical protein
VSSEQARVEGNVRGRTDQGFEKGLQKTRPAKDLWAGHGYTHTCAGATRSDLERNEGRLALQC